MSRNETLKYCVLGVSILVAANLAVADETPAPLGDLLSLHDGSPPVSKAPQTTVDQDTQSALSGGLRLSSIKEEGTRDGMLAGLAWRYGKKEALLLQQNDTLNQVYDFSKVMINDFVLPPSINIMENALRQTDDNTAHQTRELYRIEYPARIVTTPPQWTDFLIKHFQPPQAPSPVILPKTSEEVKLWNDSVKTGWKKGVAQADAIYDASLALLTRTYQGMLNYHLLVKEGVVSAPVTATSDLGIVVNGREMNVGDTIIRLTQQPSFQKANNWTPLPRDNSVIEYPK